jgi:hypothetical protein
MVWANSSWHWGSYGSIWTCPSPKKYYMDRSFWGPYDPKWHELFAILYVSSKIIMQIPLRNWIKNEAVQSRLYWPAALTRTNRENKNVKCNILYVLFSCCFCIKSNARISLNIGWFFFPTELFDKGTYQKEGSEGQHI